MTAPSDAQLVSGVLAGDRDAFAQLYDRYADRLHDFAYSMLRHREDAADAVADAFVTTAERLEQLRDPDRLRPWLYAVVRRECLRRLKARSRTAFGGDEELLDRPDESAAPETVAEQESLRALVWDAAGGLNERDRAMLDLHLRQGLDGAELGEAMGMSADNAYVGLSRLRDQVERSIGALLVARTSRADCSELTGVLDDWDGEFTPLVRKRVARHVDRCRDCTVRRAALASPAALLAGVPAFAAPLLLRDRVLEDSRLVSALASRRDGDPPEAGAGPRRGGSRSRRTAAAAGLALLLAVAGVVGVVVAQERTTGEPDLLADDPGSSSPTVPSAAPGTGLSPGQDTTQVPPPTPSPSSEPTLEATTTPSDPVSPTGPVTTGTDEPSPPATPGRLVATPARLDLGTAGGRTLTVTNRGGSTVAYSVTAQAGWLSVTPASGTLRPGQSRSVTVTAKRSGLPEGSSSGGLTVRWDEGRVPVSVTASHEVPPTIGAISAVPSESCQGSRVVDVAVPVGDESGMASVSLQWSGPTGGAGTRALTESGGLWRVSIGPFTAGTVELVVTATDTRGNTARRTTSVEVDPCPG